MICGIDEAGRGPVIGPMVVVGVLVNSTEDIQKLNLRDSKKCTRKMREKLADDIKRTAICKTIVISASEIDSFRLHSTLNELEANTFASILHELKPDIAYIDSVGVNARKFGAKVMKALTRMHFSHNTIKIICTHRADEKYAVVAAASIIAKVTRDTIIQKISTEVGMQIGSGYPSDTRTIDFIRKWYKIHKVLPPHVRTSWITAQRIIQNVK